MSRQVICYDIADDRRRTRLRTLLLGHGDAVEESVFELRLSGRRLVELRTSIQKLVDAEDDIVRIYHLCEQCMRRIEVLVGPPDRPDPPAFIL